MGEEESIERMIKLCAKVDASTIDGLTIYQAIKKDLDFFHKYSNPNIIYKMVETYFVEAKKYEGGNQDGRK